MGIKGLLKQLPGGTVEEGHVSFSSLDFLRNGTRRGDFDTGSLAYVCAWRYKEAFNAGDYIPAASEFQRQLISLKVIEKWDFTCIFDGRPPEEKQHEHRRRRERSSEDDSVVINSTYLAMCARICKRFFYKYVVAPEEADMQAGRGEEGAVVITRDSDLIAYENELVVIVDNWAREEYRVVDLNTPVTDEMKQTHPLYWYYHKYGGIFFRWWAAVMGCDISEKASGITDAGPAAFFAALGKFDEKDSSELTGG